MSNAKPVRCQKCGKLVGFITVLAKGFRGLQQPVPNVKLVAICIDCFQKKNKRMARVKI